MKVKSVMYAAIGAPVVVARRVGESANGISTKLGEQANEYGQNFEKTFDGWAVEGEKVVGRMSDRKVVDELASKVDLDQAKEQVSKLRDQLEDMLATWRTSFRPEKVDTDVKTDEKGPTTKAPAKKPATKAPATKAPATKAPAKKPATKASATKAPAKTASASKVSAKTDSTEEDSSDKAERAS